VILTNSKERTRFLRFAAVGALGAVIDFGAFNLLVWNFDVQEVLASVISYITGMMSNFTWNRYWTYPESRSKHVAHQVSQFALVNLTGLLIRTLIFALLENPLGRLFVDIPTDLPFPAENLGHNAALAIAVGIVMIWNFFVNRFWTYNDIE
jgi:putative flippase GtrA